MIRVRKISWLDAQTTSPEAVTICVNLHNLELKTNHIITMYHLKESTVSSHPLEIEFAKQLGKCKQKIIKEIIIPKSEIKEKNLK